MLSLEESTNFQLACNPARKSLYATWQGHHTPAQTQANYEVILHHTYTTQSTHLLLDALLDQDGWHKLVCWLAEDYFRHLAHAGIRAVAWVLPRDLRAFCDTYQVIQRLHWPLIDTFTDAAGAYSWLHSAAVISATPTAWS